MRRVVSSSVVALAVLVTSVVVLPRRAHAEGGPFGLGLIVGSPTGLSMKYYLGESGQAIDAALGAAFIGADGLHAHADYLWHPFLLTDDPAFSLPLHFGVGVRVLSHDRGRDDSDDDVHLGVRVPVGLTFDFKEIPLDAFFEVAVIVDFHGDHALNNNDESDHVDLDINAGVGARYYF